ncbi:MAG TPA: ABC transporter ATP-binding protein, partial [Candidatus Dormibacteraeota bacterium]|nr:ABC transporter ATP-binding protein [Candidatus Dormibacteraeota bacterium]
SRIEHLVEMVGLGAAIDREMHSFSSGMRQRGAFARGLIHDPAVIILDEPTRSLDPIGAEEVREIVAERVAAGGRTVLIATHLMVEVESLCDRLAMIDSGSTVFAGTVEQLRSLKGEGVRYRISVNGAAIGLLPDLRRVSGVLEVTSNLGPSNDLSLELRLAKGTHALATVIRILVERGAEINNCSSLEPTLEEAFRALISQGRELAVPAVAS